MNLFLLGDVRVYFEACHEEVFEMVEFVISSVESGHGC